jgi:hypothetical protein
MIHKTILTLALASAFALSTFCAYAQSDEEKKGEKKPELIAQGDEEKKDEKKPELIAQGDEEKKDEKKPELIA